MQWGGRGRRAESAAGRAIGRDWNSKANPAGGLEDNVIREEACT